MTLSIYNMIEEDVHLVHDVPGEHEGAGGEGPGVELVQGQDPGELLEEVFLKQRDLNISCKILIVRLLSSAFKIF